MHIAHVGIMWKNGKLFDPLAVPSSKQTPRQASAPFVKTEPTNVTFRTRLLQEHCLHSLTLPRLHEKQRSRRPSCTRTPPFGPLPRGRARAVSCETPICCRGPTPFFFSLCPLCPQLPFSPRPSSTGLLVTKYKDGDWIPS